MLYTVAKLSEQNSMLASMGDLHVSPTSIRLSFTPPPSEDVMKNQTSSLFVYLYKTESCKK